MDSLKYTGKLKQYFLAPLYLVFVLIAIDAGLYFYDIKAGAVFSSIIIIYSLCLVVFYSIFRKKLAIELINFGTRYGTIQKEMLNKFHIPYAILDLSGNTVWQNEKFRELSELDSNFHGHISKLFPEAEKIKFSDDEDNMVLEIKFKEKLYHAELQKIEIPTESGNQLITFDKKNNALVSLMLFDITELTALKKENQNIKMVPAVVYIDNYEETVEHIEIVKRSLLAAVIDRKITQYFQNVGGIVEKIEKDKYFVIFEHRYLEKLTESKFSILEDVKAIKVGNDVEVTLSIGVGAGGNSYLESVEFANAAINIALGRGGSQAVVKDSGKVSYYGTHGKEIERTTRVKARVKAQALHEMMETHDNVIVMGHTISDIDALGAGIGVYAAARVLGKKTQIVLNTITSSLRPLVDNITNMDESAEDMIVNSEGALRAVNSNTLLVVVDTNKANYTECPELLKKCSSIVVFDHHRQGDGQIENPTISYIEPYASSACEMIAEMLQYFSDQVRLFPQEADCIYAGMLIDTNNFMTKTGVRTFEAAAYLRRSGASMTRVRMLLREDMDSYKARAGVVREAEVYRSMFAISSFPSEGVDSPTIICAQAANELLDIVGIKASFVLTNFQDKVYISARSIDEIDVQMIMEKIGGGGHLNVAGAQLKDATIDSAKLMLEQILDTMIDEGDIVE